MKFKHFGYILALLIILGCRDKQHTQLITLSHSDAPLLNIAQGNRLAALPLGCIQVQYPNKLGQTLNDSTHINNPKSLHPAFYGCFDWHSAVHGHWSLVSLLRQFPNLEHADKIRKQLRANISYKNMQGEMAYFNMKGNQSYERTYGWAWLLKLAEELHAWEDPLGRELSANLQPLTELIIEGYINFLPKLKYPIRVGEHSNTAFGLSMAWDYANAMGHNDLKKSVEECVYRFYLNDASCPIDWEPSGFDFLSPCLEEANLVRKVLPKKEFKIWFDRFLPSLTHLNFKLEPGGVTDRTDGKLVHLDGLNFSRAWCLYGISASIPEYEHLKAIANDHINYSLSSIVDGNYGGTHWLGTFALHALNNTH